EAWLPWDVFRALAAGALTRLDLHPIRYRTQWPTLKAVYAMVAASEPRD
ncbi:MAG: glutathione S-transferase, partial [Myxococcota bacterium]